MSELVKLFPKPPRGRPTLERMLAFLKSSDYNFLIRSFDYLKEYESGLEIVEKLLNFVEHHPNFDIRLEEHKDVLLHLLRHKLDLLDTADKWDDFIRLVEALRQRSELQIASEPTPEAVYNKLKDLLDGNYPKSYKAQVADAVAELDAGEWTTSSDGQRAIICPPKHLVDSWGMKERVRVVQKKLARRDQGKTVSHLRHKQVWQLTEREYQDRIDWLKSWREYCHRMDELMKTARGPC